jgi:hypothetical protein
MRAIVQTSWTTRIGDIAVTEFRVAAGTSLGLIAAAFGSGHEMIV